MGMQASATCEMIYENAVGELVGEENRGLANMFTMMNAARLVTGLQGLGMAAIAQQNAAAYALERLQGRALDGAKYPDKPADPIIVHPDVRRMLLIGKASVEGARALGLYTGVQLELEQHHPDAEVRERAGHWVALMTPIIKAYFTDLGSEVANLGMQVHGGAGYIVDTGVEQFARDVRITQIYEGTNGVQALDLVGRKLVANSGETLKSFFTHAEKLIAETPEPELAEFVTPLKEALGGCSRSPAGSTSRWPAIRGSRRGLQRLPQDVRADRDGLRLDPPGRRGPAQAGRRRRPGEVLPGQARHRALFHDQNAARNAGPGCQDPRRRRAHHGARTTIWGKGFAPVEPAISIENA